MLVERILMLSKMHGTTIKKIKMHVTETGCGDVSWTELA